MGIKATFGVTKETVKEGVWINYGDDEKIKISMVSPHNTEFQKEMNRLQKKYRRAIQLETLDDEEGNELLHQVYAKTIVLDWQGITEPDIEDEDAPEIPFSVENCVRVFKKYPHLFADIREQSQSLALFMAAQQEVNAKNLQPS